MAVYRAEPVFIIPMNVFLFLLGVRLMRSGAFSPDGRRIRRRMLRWGLALGLPLNLLYFVPGGHFELPVRYLFAPVLSLGYAGLVAAATERNVLPWFSARLAEVGRAALSCYVLQNVLASVVFYGWGLGLTGEVGSGAALLILIGICAALTLRPAVLFAPLAATFPVRTARDGLEEARRRPLRQVRSKMTGDRAAGSLRGTDADVPGVLGQIGVRYGG
jgi:uncharacterized protein